MAASLQRVSYEYCKRWNQRAHLYLSTRKYPFLMLQCSILFWQIFVECLFFCKSKLYGCLPPLFDSLGHYWRWLRHQALTPWSVYLLVEGTTYHHCSSPHPRSHNSLRCQHTVLPEGFTHFQPSVASVNIFLFYTFTYFLFILICGHRKHHLPVAYLVVQNTSGITEKLLWIFRSKLQREIM